jgi:4-hydroxy-4-methyl-2-oxoglutarate aldolase
MQVPTQPTPTLWALVQRASAAAVYEAAGQQGDLQESVRALTPRQFCAGIAYTVQAPARAGHSIVQAIDAAAPGSILVIEMGDDLGCALGGTGAGAAQQRGLVGCVTNACVRDIAEINALRFPVFARGPALKGWTSPAHGRSSVPVHVGGQLICPGDLICADDDGVVVVPSANFQKLEQALQIRLAYEEHASQAIREGGRYEAAIASKPG